MELKIQVKEVKVLKNTGRGDEIVFNLDEKTSQQILGDRLPFYGEASLSMKVPARSYESVMKALKQYGIEKYEIIDCKTGWTETCLNK